METDEIVWKGEELMERMDALADTMRDHILKYLGENKGIFLSDDEERDFRLRYASSLVMIRLFPDEVYGRISGVSNIDGKLFIMIDGEEEWTWVKREMDVLYSVLAFIRDVNRYRREKHGR